MKKLIFLSLLSITSLFSITFENKTIDKYIPEKNCEEIIIKNSTITNSKLECKKVFIENSILKGSTVLGKLSLTMNNVTVSDTISKGHIIDCVNCLEYTVFNSKFTNNEGVSIIYNFGNAFIGKNIEFTKNKARSILVNVNNETMYDIWTGDKIQEKRYDFTKKYKQDIDNGVFILKEYENNYLLASDIKMKYNIADYGIYSVRTWDYFTKNSFLENVSIQEAFVGMSYQRTLMKMILPYFTAIENSDITENYFKKATIAGENIMSYNSKIGGNIIFTETLQGFNNVFVNGAFYQGYNNNVVHSQFNFNTVPNLLINSVFINFDMLSDKDMLARNSISNRPLNGDNNIYETDINKIYDYVKNSNLCGVYPFDYLKHELFDYVFPYLNKDATFQYIGRNKSIVNKNETCSYTDIIFKQKNAQRETEGIIFENSNIKIDNSKDRDITIFTEKDKEKKATFEDGFSDLEKKKDERDISEFNGMKKTKEISKKDSFKEFDTPKNTAKDFK